MSATAYGVYTLVGTFHFEISIVQGCDLSRSQVLLFQGDRSSTIDMALGSYNAVFNISVHIGLHCFKKPLNLQVISVKFNSFPSVNCNTDSFCESTDNFCESIPVTEASVILY